MRIPRFVPLPWSVVNAVLDVALVLGKERALRDREAGRPCGCRNCTTGHPGPMSLLGAKPDPRLS